MNDLPQRWRTPSRWPRVGRQYVHVCDAAFQVYNVLYGDADHLPSAGFKRHVAQIIGDWCRDGDVPTYILPIGRSELRPGRVSDWIGKNDVEHVEQGYIQRPPEDGGKLWVYCDVYLGRDAFLAWMDGLKKATAPSDTGAVTAEPEESLPLPPRGKQGKALLQRFYQRLRAGETEPTSTAEYNAICKAWGDPKEAPSMDTWQRVVGPYWRRLSYTGRRQALDPHADAHVARIAAG